MGHDEGKNNFGGGVNPASNSAMDELNRISADLNPNRIEATGTGDIKLSADKGPKDKKIFIIAILAVLIVIAFAANLFITKNGIGGIGGKSSAFKDEDLAAIFEKYSDGATKYEDILKSINNGEFDASGAFNEEAKKITDESYNSVKSLQSELNAHEKAANDVKTEALKALKDKLKTVMPAYDEAKTIYDDYYSAIVNLDKSSIEKYLSKGGNVATATKAYVDYIENAGNITNISNAIEQSNCISTTGVAPSQATNCISLIDAEMKLTAALTNTEYLKYVFAPTISNTFSNKDTLTAKIVNLRGMVN